MSFNYTVSRQDLWRCMFVLANSSDGGCLGIVGVVACNTVIAMLMVAPFTMLPDSLAIISAGALALLGLPLVVGYIVLWVTTFFAVMAVPPSRTPYKVTTTLNLAGITNHLPDGEKTVPWMEVTTIIEYQEDVYFYKEHGTFFVPRNAFASPEQAQAFLTTAQEYWQRSRSPEAV